MQSTQHDVTTTLRTWLTRSLGRAELAATLTFRPYLISSHRVHRGVTKLNATEAQLAIHSFLRRLDAEAFGKAAIRHGRRLQCIPIREGGFGPDHKHLHYHLQMEVPKDFTAAEWAAVAASCWRKVEWASPDQNVFREIRDTGWNSYILKLRDKPNFADAVDFENLRIH